jgi:hypothetical protein
MHCRENGFGGNQSQNSNLIKKATKMFKKLFVFFSETLSETTCFVFHKDSNGSNILRFLGITWDLLFMFVFLRRHDTRQNDTRQSDTWQNDTQQNITRQNDTRHWNIQENNTRNNDFQLNNTHLV